MSDTGGTDEVPAVFRCHVVAEDAEALRKFIEETRPDTGCRPVARETAAGLGLDLYFRQDQLDSARSARSAPRVNITSVENITENWQARDRSGTTTDTTATITVATAMPSITARQFPDASRDPRSRTAATL
ncbi:hypothetical protein [Streptomyces swartbergensis]|uniref:Uncharacterized protein n=1 Tax=Streptomyces swartbergensis TaxID=487165 RepID=A0A243RZ80_9ACTN|nr:hypothetical protein [Streptomyces swartbergensis]OUD00541.1 hypothetical protein CA983_24990 [Streptomyces swartbergensis]